MKPIFKLELVDWKQLELSCITAMDDARKQYALNEEMLKLAHLNIKELGGLTREEELAQEKEDQQAAAEKTKLAKEDNAA